MELREAAQAIRDTVSMQEILDLYGYQPKNSTMVCPFHGDHDASLHVYKGTKGWHCFGCGRGGSVIDFVMEHDGCSFPIAVKAIDSALHMGLLSPGDPFDQERRDRLTAILDDLAALMLRMIADTEKQIEIRLRMQTRETMEIEWKPRRERTAREMIQLENIYEGMKYDEYLKSECDRMREEVRTWRRNERRQQSREAR